MINHQRMLQTGAALYEQPSEIGLPQAYMSSVTIGANLKVRSRKKIKSTQTRGVWADQAWFISRLGCSGSAIQKPENLGRVPMYSVFLHTLKLN